MTAGAKVPDQDQDQDLAAVLAGPAGCAPGCCRWDRGRCCG